MHGEVVTSVSVGTVIGVSSGHFSRENARIMEKYSRWSDLTTGINPFVPHKQRLHDNVAVKGLQVLGGTALFVVRVPLVLVLGVALVVTNVVVSILVRSFLKDGGSVRILLALCFSLTLLVLHMVLYICDGVCRASFHYLDVC